MPADCQTQAQRSLAQLGKQLPFLRYLRECWQQTAPEQFRQNVRVVGYQDHQLLLRCAEAAQAAAVRRQASTICQDLRAKYKKLRYLRAIKVRAHPHYQPVSTS